VQSTETVSSSQLQETIRWPAAPRNAAEHFRLVALRLEAALGERTSRLIVVASPERGDGRTTTSLQIAGALHDALGRRVMVVDGDLHRPGLAAALGVGGGVFVSGSPDGPYALTETAESITALAARVQELRPLYDYVLVDTPPVDRSADAAILGRYSDGVLLLVRAGRTRRDKLDAALDALADTPLVGCVVTGRED
jgi:Mrp family chromosome partitioning ATPase